MHFSFVVVDCGKEMLTVETDADTVVSGTLVKAFLNDTVSSTGAPRDRVGDGKICGGSHSSRAVRLPQAAELAAVEEEQGSEHPRGVPNGWWKPADIANFEKLIAALVAEYDAYNHFLTFPWNGKQTLDGNIADLGGLAAACDAYRASLLAPAADSMS